MVITNTTKPATILKRHRKFQSETATPATTTDRAKASDHFRLCTFANIKDTAQLGRAIQQKDTHDHSIEGHRVLPKEDQQKRLHHSNALKSTCLQLFLALSSGLHHQEG